jgi:hypothetical protein
VPKREPACLLRINYGATVWLRFVSGFVGSIFFAFFSGFFFDFMVVPRFGIAPGLLLPALYDMSPADVHRN